MSDNDNHKDESGTDANDFAYGSANSGFKSYGSSDCYDDLLNDEAGYYKDESGCDEFGYDEPGGGPGGGHQPQADMDIVNLLSPQVHQMHLLEDPNHDKAQGRCHLQPCTSEFVGKSIGENRYVFLDICRSLICLSF